LCLDIVGIPYLITQADGYIKHILYFNLWTWRLQSPSPSYNISSQLNTRICENKDEEITSQTFNYRIKQNCRRKFTVCCSAQRSHYLTSLLKKEILPTLRIF
jgi:hypothetical protein